MELKPSTQAENMTQARSQSPVPRIVEREQALAVARPAQVLPLILFCLLGLAIGLLPQFFLASKSEPLIEKPLAQVGFQTVVWKLQTSYRAGDVIAVSARHRFAGANGRFRFVVYQGLSENFEKPQIDQTSEYFEAPREGDWSQWHFITQHPVLFVGIEWEIRSGLSPIALEERGWSNPLSFHSYAYTGFNTGKLAGKMAPLRADIRLESPRVSFGFFKGTLSPVSLTLLAMLGLALLLVHLNTRASTSNLIALSAGVLFSYRAWAWFGVYAPWLWGSSYISYLPLEVRIVLFAAGLILLLSLIRRRLGPTIISEPVMQLTILLALVGLAWLYRCSRVYGDSVFGYTNHTHAPFTASLYSIFDWLFRDPSWIHDNFSQLVSIGVFIPFLFLVTRMVKDRNIRGLNVAPALMLISAASLQCFFGYVEVYSVPMLWWIAFALSAFAFFEQRVSIWLPTAVAFMSYLSHVSEAMLLFPLLYLWYDEFRHRRPTIRKTALRVLSLAAFALTFTAISYSILFVFKYAADIAVFKKEFPFYGFEILAGRHHHEGVVLPFFSKDIMAGIYTAPGPDYAMVSIENLMKVIGFQFQYSILFFLLPVLMLLRDRFTLLKDPKIAFTFIAMLTYTIYAGFAYVGWLPIIRDWDLFAIYSVIGGTLTYLLLKREDNHAHYWIIAGLNFLQTVPWILMNHFEMNLPW